MPTLSSALRGRVVTTLNSSAILAIVILHAPVGFASGRAS
jgi:hypothetical protein